MDGKASRRGSEISVGPLSATNFGAYNDSQYLGRQRSPMMVE